MNRSKQLTKNTIIITIGKVSTQFVTFLLLPLYTSLLSTDDYGTIDFINTLIQLLIPIASLMIDQGCFRYLLDCKTEKDKEKVVSSSIFSLLIISIFVTIFYVIISIFFKSTYKTYNIWIILILIATVYSNLFLQIARGLKNTGLYSLGSFICSAVIVVLNVICIAWIKTGAVGMLIATFCGNIICSIFLFAKMNIMKYLKFNAFEKRLAIKILKYTIPLVPNQLSLWIMNSSDRIIVTAFLGTAANGILAISHKFPSIYMTFFGIFLLAWQEMVAIHYFDKDRDIFFSKMIQKVIKVFSSLCIIIIVLLPLIFDFFINDAYNEAYYNIPIYMVAFLFNVIIGLLGAIFVATKKSIEIVKTTLIAAIVNIIVNIILVRYIGLYAASISTLIGYFIAMVYRIIITKNYINITYEYKSYIKMVFILLISIIIYYINNKILSLIFLPIFIVSIYVYNRELMKYILNLISDFVKRKDNEK